MTTDWTGTASAYDASFARLCAGAIPALIGCLPSSRSARRVLDAGTGTGRVAEALAVRGHDVTAVDAAEDMVAFAAAERGGQGIRFEYADLLGLPFADGVFDASVANFVVNHLRVPLAGVRELTRVTRPGGIVAVTIWPSRPVSAFNRLWNEVVDRSGAVRPVGSGLSPEDDFERSESGLARLLARSGLVNVTATTVAWTFDAAPESLWRGVDAGIASIGTTYLAQDVAMRARMRGVFDEVVVGRDSIELPSTAVVAFGSVAG